MISVPPVWDYASVAPALIAILNSVIAVSISYFPAKDTRLKAVLLIFAIGSGLVAAGATIAGQRHTLEVAQSERQDAELERKKAEQRLTTLGELISEGDALEVKAAENKDAPLDVDGINAWAKKTEEFLSKELGSGFVSRFNDVSGLAPATQPLSLFAESLTGPHTQAYAVMAVRLARLQQFSQELSARLK
jgi:hypothetical protein